MGHLKRVLFVVLAASVALIGCKRAAQAVESEEAREARHRTLVRAFGEALLRGDGDAAHALLASPAREEWSGSQLLSAYQETLDGFTPDKVEASTGTSREHLQGSEVARDYGFSPAIPDEAREAWMFSVFLESSTDRCSQARVLVVRPAGGGDSQLGHVAFGPCD